MPTHHREEKINETIKRELADIILKEFNNTVEALITILDVDVEKDLGSATVTVAVLPVAVGPETLVNLVRARGFLRHRLSERHGNKNMPNLIFKLDQK